MTSPAAERVARLLEKSAAEQKSEGASPLRKRLRDSVPIIAGTALGAAGGYGLSAALGRSKLRGPWNALSPRARLGVLVPLLAITGGAIPAVYAARSADTERKHESASR